MSIEIISALTALVAVIVGPIVSIYIMKKQNTNNIKIAEKNIIASTVSSSRQKWIDTLRDSIAKFQTLIFPLSVPAASQLFTLDEKKSRVERATFLLAKISLLINPKEEDHLKLMEHIADILSSVNKGEINEVKFKESHKNITMVAQHILKREWNVIKSAV